MATINLHESIADLCRPVQQLRLWRSYLFNLLKGEDKLTGKLRPGHCLRRRWSGRLSLLVTAMTPIYGDTGWDYLNGGYGTDRIDGGAGNDLIDADGDKVNAGAGRDHRPDGVARQSAGLRSP